MNWRRETLNTDFPYEKRYLAGINERVFCTVVTNDKNRMHYDNLKGKKS